MEPAICNPDSALLEIGEFRFVFHVIKKDESKWNVALKVMTKLAGSVEHDRSCLVSSKLMKTIPNDVIGVESGSFYRLKY